MTTLTLSAIFVGCGALLAYVLFSRVLGTHSGDRPNINIDFDSAKEREDKNRYFS
ncbi:MAG: hypothetical protein V3571_03545 [Pseudodesulfovibrio sp.]